MIVTKNFLLNETIINTVALYMVLKRLMTPFDEWEAFSLGLIDKDGKKLKDAVTSKERECWDLLTKFCWNFKKVLSKFVGKSKLATYISAAYLLKDGIGLFYVEKNLPRLMESDLAGITNAKQLYIHQLIKTNSNRILSEKINEDNFEMRMWQYIPLFEKMIAEKKIDIKCILGEDYE